MAFAVFHLSDRAIEEGFAALSCWLISLFCLLVFGTFFLGLDFVIIFFVCLLWAVCCNNALSLCFQESGDDNEEESEDNHNRDRGRGGENVQRRRRFRRSAPIIINMDDVNEFIHQYDNGTDSEGNSIRTALLSTEAIGIPLELDNSKIEEENRRRREQQENAHDYGEADYEVRSNRNNNAEVAIEITTNSATPTPSSPTTAAPSNKS